MGRRRTSPSEFDRADRSGQSAEDDLAVIRLTFGSWQDQGDAGSDYVDGMRSGARLQHRSED